MPTSRPLRADARRNREALLTTAREAFLAGEDIGVDEIARRAGVAVGTLYRHFDTREELIAEIYRQALDELCAEPDALLERHAPDRALREFLDLLVEHAATSKGMSVALESVLATDSAVFAGSRQRMAGCLDALLRAGAAAGTIRGDVDGWTVLRALGCVCGMRATDGWRDDAARIVALLFDGLRHVGTAE
ncbi:MULTISPECIES: TetR/AcrR family transcriptional regulator [unclassified Saccharopolyspora]|uniref:TetR/AcrR family transcriptional regulator n=1 Tax=unclassified Saccharopolyspora TaxID=2646250 RepID=UPI001CD5EF98|nr:MULTISPECIES: helix-turn-helix domain-containing protein [unclassified Saccharopolyspora]MCA1188681.1 TetR/AcrR family transcriptional regulator [Saccharopolyspora sp. 6T]MCA1281084.1 TetR/AcrR family transcriptional regulator [Saccharopolyspora sp. 7B]